MSWAAGRETTRVEDIAYCVLGIFGVKTGTIVVIFIYGTNSVLARLELNRLWMLRRSLPEMVPRVSKTERD
jgi:hypothetical protein